MGGIKPIPTIYNGIQFRSRLEATWAAFFDLIGWKWEYEPFDMDGWIPDFMIVGRDQEVLVEVKPIIEFDCELAKELEGNSGFDDREILILGCGIPARQKTAGMETCFGWIGVVEEPSIEEMNERNPDEDDEYDKMLRKRTCYGRSWVDCLLRRWSDSKDKIGFCPVYNFVHNRITGIEESDQEVGHIEIPEKDIKRIWNKAKNLTQWKSPRRRGGR